MADILDFYVSKTLLHVYPDTNRRVIRRGIDGEEMWSRKPGPQGWSHEDQEACDNALAALRRGENPPE